MNPTSCGCSQPTQFSTLIPGPAGPSGPSNIDGTTSTSLTGFLTGAAGSVAAQPVPIPVASGGTNAITSAAALTSLGAYPAANVTALTQIKGAGTFTANGTNAVAVNDANVTANSVVMWTFKSGTPPTTPLFVSAITAGASFTVKNTASDSATYNYVIIN